VAGYIMTLDDLKSLELCIRTGTYSTNLSDPKGYWGVHHEGTFADFFSMKENDNIYFFIKRKIYGLGRIINIQEQCRYLNYENADLPKVQTKIAYKPLLPYSSAKNRCFCTFIPYPYFFKTGIDMDDVLNSNPSKFRMLRALWKLSFIKIDDEENQALIDIILKRNEDSIFSGSDTFLFEKTVHDNINLNLSKDHDLNSKRLLSCSSNGKLIKHEMAIEAALCELLISNNNTVFGEWDYISHQVIASPFKAIDYMDKMDIFGYRYIKGYKTRSEYLVIEIKKDTAKNDVIDQIMKYIDWINKEYTYGDYSMIKAYIIAADFPEKVVNYRNLHCVRNFTKGYRPTKSCTWNYVKLVKYTYENEKLDFKLI
jgi:hypothetical protein